MKQLAIFLLIAFSANSAYSQKSGFTTPDYNLIKSEIQDSASIFYYPNLLSRLNTFDTTLTNQDYRHLYYGYLFQEKYEPYWMSPYEEELSKYYQSRKIKEKDYDKIIELATHSINDFPFDLRQLNFLSYTYHLKGDEETAKKIAARFTGTLDAIMSSGNGETCETGYHVISVSHEYVILKMFQFQIKSQALTGDCDYFRLERDGRNIDRLYFNIKQLFSRNAEKFETE
jgi:hypothetical protein